MRFRFVNRMDHMSESYVRRTWAGSWMRPRDADSSRCTTTSAYLRTQAPRIVLWKLPGHTVGAAALDSRGRSESAGCATTPAAALRQQLLVLLCPL